MFFSLTDLVGLSTFSALDLGKDCLFSSSMTINDFGLFGTIGLVLVFKR